MGQKGKKNRKRTSRRYRFTVQLSSNKWTYRASKTCLLVAVIYSLHLHIILQCSGRHGMHSCKRYTSIHLCLSKMKGKATRKSTRSCSTLRSTKWEAMHASRTHSTTKECLENLVRVYIWKDKKKKLWCIIHKTNSNQLKINGVHNFAAGQGAGVGEKIWFWQLHCVQVTLTFFLFF